MIIGVVRVRGMWGIKPKIRKTLQRLNLTRVNHATLIPDTSYYMGMLKVCKDYVAFGKVSKDVAKKLLIKKGEITRNKKLKDDNTKMKDIDNFLSLLDKGETSLKRFGIKPVMRLKPPKHGYKSVKRAYPYGALGKWPSLDNLIERMF
ncbi:50S ribosomal protein L30 [Candidatus Micrarchaeota archaeon]|nr:50S ribosomal protein L30 [Candidatus Micrarchaeota archaeon]